MEFEHIKVPEGIDITVPILPQREIAGNTTPALYGIDVAFLAEAAIERVLFAGGTVDLEVAKTALTQALSSSWTYYIDMWLYDKLDFYHVSPPEPLEAKSDQMLIENPDYFDFNDRGAFFDWNVDPGFNFKESIEKLSDDAIDEEVPYPTSPERQLSLDVIRYYYEAIKRMNFLRNTLSCGAAEFSLKCEKQPGAKDFAVPDDPEAPNGNFVCEYYHKNKSAWDGSYEESYGGYIWQYLFERSAGDYTCEIGDSAKYITNKDSEIVALVDFFVREAFVVTSSSDCNVKTCKVRKRLPCTVDGSKLKVKSKAIYDAVQAVLGEVGVMPRTDYWLHRISVEVHGNAVYFGLREKTRLDSKEEENA